MITAAALRQIVDVPINKVDADLQPFLTAAALIRSEDLGSSGLSTARLDLIELQLAAHFATLTIEFGGIQAWDNGQANEKYKQIATSDKGYNSTRYGQQALALDSSGTLANASTSGLKAQFRVVSVNPPCRTPTRTC